MADWTTLPNAAVGVGGLPSGATVTALRDNPIAIAEGATGAPRNKPQSLDIVSDLIEVTGDNFITLTDLENVRHIWFYCFASNPDGLGTIHQFSLSTNNGSTWTAARGFGTYGAEGFILTFDLSAGKVMVTGAAQATFWDEGAATYNALRFRQASISSSSILLKAYPRILGVR